MSVGCVLLLQLKKDKVELENQLEQEQEALVNRLWKRMDKLEAEKRLVLDQKIQNANSNSNCQLANSNCKVINYPFIQRA